MEENTFLDYNPQYATRSGMGQTLPTQTQNDYLEARNSELETGVLGRWLNPGIEEAAAFDRENFMVDKANAFTEYMWNKTNEYNSPAAQMQRAKEAGINLNLAAGGIMGSGNATAQPQQGAKGTAQMQANGNPISEIASAAGGIKNLIDGANGLDKIFNFGKTEKAMTKKLNEEANKIAQEADFTYWQKRQFRRTMNIMADQLYKDYETAEQNLRNLQKLYEVYDQQKWNIAEDTNLKTAQTGETIERTKTQVYKNWEEQFKKAFRDLYGVQLNESDLSMLVQAILSGKGETIINGITDTFKSILKALGREVKEYLPQIPKLPSIKTPKKVEINGMKMKEKEISMKRWEKLVEKQIQREWDAKPRIREFYKDKGGFEAFKEKRMRYEHQRAGHNGY